MTSRDDLSGAVKQLGGYGTGMYAEKWAPFEKELAIMVARCTHSCLLSAALSDFFNSSVAIAYVYVHRLNPCVLLHVHCGKLSGAQHRSVWLQEHIRGHQELPGDADSAHRLNSLSD